MSTLLFIETSPRDGASTSTAIARSFLDAYAGHHPADTIETLNVWTTRLPEFDGDVMEAKYAALRGAERTPAQAAAWDEISAIAARVRDADTLVFGVPMWNFGIPYKLKHLIDAISQKDLLFTFDASGFGGLARARKALVVYARGIDYGRDSAFATPAAEWDQQKPYLDLWLRFIGVGDVASIVVEGTLMGSDASAVELRDAHAQARVLATDF